jgi:hypothetical protein
MIIFSKQEIDPSGGIGELPDDFGAGEGSLCITMPYSK